MTAFGSIQHDPAAGRIRQAATRGALTHALLFTGAGQRETLAVMPPAAMECECGGERPCLRCESCRRVMEGIHPDVITVRDDQHKSIAVDVVRQIRQDAYIRPNQGRRKVYLFPDCALLTPQDQNVLLKIVEEGPPYAAFIFCTDSPAALLETVRSRCVLLKCDAPAPDALPPEAGAAVPRLRQGKAAAGDNVSGVAGEPADEAGGAAGRAAGRVVRRGGGPAAADGQGCARSRLRRDGAGAGRRTGPPPFVRPDGAAGEVQRRMCI